MQQAVIIGGSGTIGRAVARRLLDDGWGLHLLGRDPAHLPADLRRPDVRFSRVDRADPAALARTLAGGSELLLDCVCYTAAHARGLLPLLADTGSAVMISSKAVYVDAAGNHSNSPEPPRFTGPVAESQPTLPPSDSDEYDSRLGYGRCKVAAEQVLLDSGHPVTVLRPSKVHGEGPVAPREWVFVKRALDRRPVLLLAGGGRGADHTSAAANIAALVGAAARRPGRQVLNAADPDAPDGLRIARCIAALTGHEWREVLLDDDAPVGHHPWDRRPPVVLDTTAAAALGYRPVGDYAATVAPTVAWLRRIARPGAAGLALPAEVADDAPFDYAAEDAYLADQR